MIVLILQFGQFIEMTCDPTQLIITCQGDMSDHKRIFKADGSEGGIRIKVVENGKDDPPSIIRLIFDLKYINTMNKCSLLCDDMEIYLNTDKVMFLKYGIKLLGEMYVGISPANQKQDQMEDYNEDDDDYYEDDDEIMYKA